MAYKTIPALLLLLAILHISPPAAQGAYVRLPGALTWVTSSNSGDTWGVNSAQNIWHLENGNWVLKPGQLVQISAGVSGVWGVTQSDTIFRWNGAQWVNVPGLLRRVSSGSSVWGVNSGGEVFRYLGNNAWSPITSPKLKEISVGDDGEVWAVTQDSRILRREAAGWTVIPGSLERIGVGSAGVLGVNSVGQVWSWAGAGSGWTLMEGALAQLDSGLNLVGVNRAMQIYEWREDCPVGTAWDNESQFCVKCAGGKRRLLAGTCDVTLLLISYLLVQFQNGVGTPPTVPDILSNYYVQQVMCMVWRMSILGNNRYQERGGWIYALPSNPQRIYVRMANVRRSQPALDGPGGSNPSIDLNNPDSSPGNPAPPGYVVVANFHSHPFPTADPEPSTADRDNAYFRGVPGIVLSRNRIYYYGPQSRQTMAGVRGYPGSNGEVFNGQASRTLAADWWPCPPL